MMLSFNNVFPGSKSDYNDPKNEFEGFNMQAARSTASPPPNKPAVTASEPSSTLKTAGDD